MAKWQLFHSLFLYVYDAEIDMMLLRELIKAVKPEERLKMVNMVRNFEGETVVIKAVKKGDTEVVKCVMESLASKERCKLMRMQDLDGDTAIHWAASAGQTEILESLLNSVKAEECYQILKVQDMKNCTAIHCAAWKGHTKSIMYLLGLLPPDQQVQLLDLRDEDNKTSLDVAATAGNATTLKRLRQHRKKASAQLSQENSFWWRKVNVNVLWKQLTNAIDLNRTVDILTDQVERQQEVISEKDQQLLELQKKQAEELADFEMTRNATRENKEQVEGSKGFKPRPKAASMTETIGQMMDMLEQWMEAATNKRIWGMIPYKEYFKTKAQEIRQQVEEVMDHLSGQSAYRSAGDDTSSVPAIAESSSSSDEEVGAKSSFRKSPIPPDLTEQLNGLCAENGVTKHILLRDAKNKKSIEIFGIDVKERVGGKLSQIACLWGDYEITLRNQKCSKDSKYAKQFMWECPVFDKFSIAERKWKCELIVEARNLYGERVYYAVGPAHMMFAEERNRRLQDGNELEEARDDVAEIPPVDLYAVQFTVNDGEEDGEMQDDRTFMGYAEKDSHPLLGYRYHPEPDAEFDSLDFFGNDVVLLKLRWVDALVIDQQLNESQPSRRPRMMNVLRNGVESLNEYVQGGPIRIKVKGLTGQTVANRFELEQQLMMQMPCRLLFQLQGKRQLVPGDSGCIVYEVRSSEALRPLAMFIGQPPEDEGYGDEVYQAVFLKQAFQDIERAYENTPWALTDIQPRRPRTN